MEEVMVIDPVHGDIEEADDVADEDRPLVQQGLAGRRSPALFSSSTMMVRMMAITPSENASSRPGDSGSSPTIRFLARCAAHARQ